MLGILFVVALLSAVLALVFFVQARSNGAGLLALRADLEQARKDGEGDRTSLKEAQAELKTRGQQLVEVREKLADARKKGEPKANKGATRGAREAELEEDLAHARKLAEEAHAAESAARKDVAAARAAESAAKAELARAQERVRELASRPAAAPVAGAAAGPDPLVEAAHKADDRRRAAEARAAELEAAVNGARDRELKAKDELKKAKGRAETNSKAFLVTKSELELAKERLAQAERRLWQAGITLPVPASKERPKAKGPAAADRPKEEAAAAAPAQPGEAPGASAESAASAPAEEAAAPEAAPIAESAAAAVEEVVDSASGGPQAVSPLRRRPAAGAEATKTE